VTPSTPPLPVRGRGRPPVNPAEVRGLPGLAVVLARVGWTQAQLAAVLGTSAAVVSTYATGRHDPSASLVRRAAAHLGCSADELINVPVDLATPAAPAA